MQQRRGRGRQDTGHAQADQQEVKADDLAIVAVDTLHERVTQAFERQQCVQIIGADRDIGHFARDGRAVTDSDAGICLGECRGIIHTVAEHEDFAPGRVLRLNEGGLVFREHFGEIGIHADRLCDRTGGLFIVTGHHDQLGHAEFPQSADDISRFRAQRVLNADDCRQHPGNSEVQVRIRIRQGVEFGLFPCRDGAVLVVEDKMVAADDDLLPVDTAGNAVG